MESLESPKAYDKLLITKIKSMPEKESERIIALILKALKGLEDGVFAEVDKVDSFYRLVIKNQFGMHSSSYYERHILLYLILTFSSILVNPLKWEGVLKSHIVTYVAEGQVAVLFNALDEFYTLMEISKMEQEKIIKFPGGGE